MKHLLLLSGLSLLFTTAALAGSEGPCASFAKYGAIRAFKAEPHRPTAEPIFEVNHMRTKNEKSLYHVAVNEDSREIIAYYVTVEAGAASCNILDVTQTSVGNF